MQTVNFQCGHCNNLMAVSTDYLGQQVRCPHCQQVVLAPSALPESPEPTFDSMPEPPPPLQFREPEPFFPEPKPFDHDDGDIFGEPSSNSDSLFPEEPYSLPRENRLDGILETTNLIPNPGLDLPNLPPSLPMPGDQTVGSYNPPTPASNNPVSMPWLVEPQIPEQPGYSPSGGANHLPPPPAYTPPAPPSLRESEPPRERKIKKASINLFFPLVFIPLLLYSVVMTAAVVLLYTKMSTSQPHPLDLIQDVGGDKPGTQPAKRQVFKQSLATTPLLAKQKVELGKTIRLGDLEVTPTKVERKTVGVYVEGFDRPEPAPYSSLVLHLKLKSFAEDYSFVPMDNFFDRKLESLEDAPLTILQTKSTNFFGGTCRWVPEKRDRKRGQKREWLAGRQNVGPTLLPGQEMETFVATNGEDKAVQRILFGIDDKGAKTLEAYNGSLMWRVQLRRGLVDHNGRRVSATTVIGVEFTDKDYLK